MAHLLCSKGQSLRYSPGWGNPSDCVVVFYVGEGSEREQCHLFSSLPGSRHYPSYPQTNWALWCWFPGGWLCVRSRTLWVSPRNSPVRLGVPPTTSTPTGFFSQRFWGFIFWHWNHVLHDLSHSPVVPHSLSICKCGTAHSTNHHLAHPSLPATALLQVFSAWLPISVPATSLDECFFQFLGCQISIQFNFLAVLVIFCF